jgi:esterase/lipase superfamily enzyme
MRVDFRTRFAGKRIPRRSRAIVAISAILLVSGCPAQRTQRVIQGAAAADSAGSLALAYSVLTDLTRERPGSMFLAPLDSSFSSVEIFFGTNRALSGDSDPNKFFSGDRSELRFGMARVSVPVRRHRPGNVERPSRFLFLEGREDPAKHVVISGLQLSPPGRWMADIGRQASYGRNILVYVHGFQTTFADAARRAGQLSYDLGLDDAGAVALFSWPSKGTMVGYPADGVSAEASAPALTTFLLRLLDCCRRAHITLLSHSMGGRVLSAALRNVQAERPDAKFSQVILAAPDIDAQVFRDQVAPMLSRVAGLVTMYMSTRDAALGISKAYHQYPRAGETNQLVMASTELDKIDASAIDTDLIGHGYYAENKAVIDDLFMLIRRDMPAGQRNLRKEIGYPRTWRFP